MRLMAAVVVFCAFSLLMGPAASAQDGRAYAEGQFAPYALSQEEGQAISRLGTSSRHFDVAFVASDPWGDVPLDAGIGLQLGGGFRHGRFTYDVTMGGTTHQVGNGGTFALGDSLPAFSGWDLTWLGIEAQYHLRPGSRAQPFAMVNVSAAFITAGSDNNVRGWRGGAGVGYEYYVHDVVSLVLTGRVDHYSLENAKADGRSFRLADPVGETALSLSLAVRFHDYTWSD